ncbi:MAG: aldehyde ferredoxin oxidoreductase family protein [Candidatus Heimdallarchaeota archaeon]|nr:aldehyde ferredoxin oxidoreductase family protein [Candidatus Heimdallarchaeota archaeon]
MTISGYSGLFLKVNLSTGEIVSEVYPESWKEHYIGGRGFAIKYLWDNVPAGADPLGPDNALVFMIGPLSGLSLPSSAKMIVASKSPLTGGYGDGNLGTRASPQLKRAGYDGIIIIGKAKQPVYLEITTNGSKLHNASHLWGFGTYDTEKKLKDIYGSNAGFLSIGQAGENLISYATVRSQHGRSGGRPGMGAVMGSKLLKAIVVSGTLELPMADPTGLKKLGSKGYDDIKNASFYEGWMATGTNQVLEWVHEASSLPTRNFQEGTFEGYKNIDATALHENMTDRFGCDGCNMKCGMAINDEDGNKSELDYENIGMLGANIGIDNLKKVGVLNWMADDFGIDTISLGSVLGMAAEASEQGIIEDEISFGNYKAIKSMVSRIVKREDGLADLLAKGTKAMVDAWGDKSKNMAMHVKGLECSAYNAFTIPGMALSFATSPIGAHHKDAWVISYELQTDRESYDPSKAEKVIELQRIRGGMFESLTTCRFPWIELGYDISEYPKYLQKVTGQKHWELDEVFKISDRIYALIRAFWVREFHAAGINWDRNQDFPPQRWFNETLKGNSPHVGKNLDRDKYNELLSHYYRIRGWNDHGIPKTSTFIALDLLVEYQELQEEISKNTK